MVFSDGVCSWTDTKSDETERRTRKESWGEKQAPSSLKVETPPPLGFLEVHAAFTPLPMSVAGSRQCDRQTSLRLLACYRGANITSFYAMTVTALTLTYF